MLRDSESDKDSIRNIYRSQIDVLKEEKTLLEEELDANLLLDKGAQPNGQDFWYAKSKKGLPGFDEKLIQWKGCGCAIIIRDPGAMKKLDLLESFGREVFTVSSGQEDFFSMVKKSGIPSTVNQRTLELWSGDELLYATKLGLLDSNAPASDLPSDLGRGFETPAFFHVQGWYLFASQGAPVIDLNGRKKAAPILEPIAAGMAKIGFTPAAVTILGLLVTIAGAALMATGYLFWGAFTAAVGVALDALDGPLARKQGTASDRGAFLDTMSDRFGEIAIWVGLSVYLRDEPRLLVLCIAAAAAPAGTRHGSRRRCPASR